MEEDYLTILWFAFVAHDTDDEKATLPSRQGTSG